MRERKLYERPSNKKARFGRVPIFPRPFRPGFARKSAILPLFSAGERGACFAAWLGGGRFAMEKRDSCPHFRGAEAGITWPLDG